MTAPYKFYIMRLRVNYGDIKMSEFNLEQFMNGTPAYTRDGTKAEFVGYCDKCASGGKLVVFLAAYEFVKNYYENGQYIGGNSISDKDLVRMAGKYDHIKEGDLVVVWNDAYDNKLLGRFGREENGKALCFISRTVESRWDNCLTVEEYAEKYL